MKHWNTDILHSIFMRYLKIEGFVFKQNSTIMLRNMQRRSINTMRTMATYQQSRFGYPMLGGTENYYDVLKVPLNSSGKEIKRAYIELSKKYHPDGNNPTCNSDEFVKVCEAYKILYKRASRNHYNNRMKTHWHMVAPIDNSYSNKNVHKAWEKYQAAMRYKQFGHDIPSFHGSSIVHKRPLVIKAKNPTPIKIVNNKQNFKFGERGSMRIPYLYGHSKQNWKFNCYMAGFSLVGVLLAYDVINKVKRNPTTPSL